MAILCKAMFRALLVVALAAGVSAPLAPVAALAQQTGASTGLPLPRFVVTRSTPINVRVGPGTRYDVAFVFIAEGIPVEIIQEFDTWRRIRDVEGAEGWVHQNLLAGRRAGYVRGAGGEHVPLLARASAEADVRAYLGEGFKVEISGCDGEWCEVSATHQAEGARAATYRGFLDQDRLWGVYANERF